MEQRYNLHNLEALFKDFLISENISRVSIKNYLSDIRHFLAWFEYVLQDELDIASSPLSCFIEQSRSELIYGYISYLESKSTPVRTINRRLSSLRNFYRFCSVREIISINPMQGVLNKVREPLNRKLSGDHHADSRSNLLDEFSDYIAKKEQQSSHDSLIKTFKDIFDTK